MKDENSVPAAQKMTDVSLSIFRSKFKKTRIQMIDYNSADFHMRRFYVTAAFLIAWAALAPEVKRPVLSRTRELMHLLQANITSRTCKCSKTLRSSTPKRVSVR